MSDLSFLEKFKSDEDDILEELGLKIKKLKDIRKDIDFMDDKLKEAKKKESSLSGEEIPNILLSRGLSSIRLDTGEKVEIKEKIAATVPKNPLKKKIVLRWLIKNEGGYLVKNKISIEDPGNHVEIYLKEKGEPYEKVLEVNTGSFKAFLAAKLGMKKGSLQTLELGEIPTEANPFIYRETKIS